MSLRGCRRWTPRSRRPSDSWGAQKGVRSPQDGDCRPMAFITDLIGCERETLRDDGEFALYRVRQPSNAAPLLALVAARPAPGIVARLENEYGLAALLDARGAARTLALQRPKG